MIVKDTKISQKMKESWLSIEKIKIENKLYIIIRNCFHSEI